MIDADTNDNQQGAEESTENTEELPVENASADVDSEQTVNSIDESTVEDGLPGEDTSFEDAFSAESEVRVALQQQIESLQAQLDERSGQFARLTADFDNFRKRTVKERETLEEQVKCNTISGLLEVVDNFERARSQIKPQGDGELTIHKSYQGVYKQLVDALKKLGVSPMRSEGKEFDPNLHEAVMREPTNDYPEGTVIEEFVRGYVLGERVLRHAMVKVATPLDSAESG